MIKAKKSKLPGFDAEIEVRGSIFNLRNVFEEETKFTHIDIHDKEGKFLDEFSSGFGIDLNDEDELEAKSVETFEYIDDNLVF